MEPDEGPNFEVDNDSLLERIGRWDQLLEQHWAPWREEARNDYDMVAGRQWFPEAIAEMEEQNRIPVTFNRIETTIDAVSGAEIMGRQEVTYLPRTVEDTGPTDVLSQGAQYVRQNCDAEDEESDSCRDTLICGMGWCLTGDANVRLPRSHLATTREYTGRVIQIDLENGERLTGTPNHPVLTDMGWKGLGSLHEGDNLVSARLLERVKGFPIEQLDKVVSRLEDKVDSFRAAGEARWFATASNDFNSDGAGSEVHVVYADSLLWDRFDATRGKHGLKPDFVRRGLLSRLCARLFGYRTRYGSVLASVCHAALNLAHAPRPHAFSMVSVPAFDTGATQVPSNGHRIATDTGRHFFTGKPFGVERDDSVNVFSRRSCGGSHDAVSADERLDLGFRYSRFIDDFRDWKPDLAVEAQNLDPDLIVKVSGVDSFHADRLHVHDIGTNVGLFIAGEILTSNTETTVGYEEEADGQILINRIDPLEMSVDPSSRKANCADARYIRREIKMSREEAHEFLPGVEDFDLDDRMDARQPTIVDPQVRYKNGMVDESNDEVMIKEYQWFDTEAYYRVQHPQTGEVMEVSLEDIEQAKAINPGVEMGEVRQTRRKYMRCFVAAGRIHDLKEIEAGDFTYKAMTGKRDRNKGTWYGLVRPMKDPQRFANKFFSSMIEQFVKGAKGGVMAEVGAVQDQRQFENSWAQTAEITWVPNGSLSNNRIQEKPVQPISAALPPMLEFSISSIRDVTGVNLELLGMADRQQAGVLEHQRKQAAYGILSAFFNSFRRYRKMQGRLLLKMMKLYLPEGTLARIVGEDGQAKYVPLAYGPDTMQYDVIVDEAPTSPNQKERVFAILTQFQGMFADAPPEIIAELIKYSPLPAAVSEKLAGMLNKQPSPEEIQAAQQQQAMQMEAAGQAVRKVASEAGKNEADTALKVAETRKTDMEAARDLTETIRADAEAHMMQTVSSIAGNPDV